MLSFNHYVPQVFKRLNQDYQRVEEIEIDVTDSEIISDIEDAVQDGLRKSLHDGMISIEFVDLLVVCRCVDMDHRNDFEILAVFRIDKQKLSIFEGMQPKLSRSQLHFWYQVLRCVWTYVDEATMDAPFHENLKQLLDSKLHIYDSTTFDKIFKAKTMSIVADDDVPLLNIYTIVILH